MKITIIGPTCSGKTTLADKISEKLDIPHIHIDRFWFEAGGRDIKPSDKEKTEKARAYIIENVEKALEQDAWVSDGWYSKVQPMISAQADLIIFLDIPLGRRLLNHFQRMNKPGRHKELTKWDEIKFTYEVVKRTFTKGPRMRAFVSEHMEKTTILKNYKEVEAYLETL